MKSIKDEVSLVGKIETISMTDLRFHPGEVIDSVDMGKVFIITKANKPVAVLQKLPGGLTTEIDTHGKVSYTL